MNILLLGSGGREHALAKALAGSASTSTLYCAPGNPGISAFATQVQCNIANHESVVQFCVENAIDLVVVGPEAPLADGLVNTLQDANIPAFGPTRDAAQLESSKGFAKEFMQRHAIPTARFRAFSVQDAVAALEYVNEHPLPVVLKADGLAAGKGVVIATEREEALSALDEMFGGRFGDAGSSVVVEEFMHGEEASIFAVCDGTAFVTLAPSQDHKRACDNDEGENTGGMGAYAPAAVVTDEILEKVCTRIIQPVVDGMKTEGKPFVGCLYVGLMIDNGEPKVVEFNARFGDPETQAVLAVFRGDFAALLYSAAIGKLEGGCIENIAEGFACNVVLASQGYPGSYEKGHAITGIDAAEECGAAVFHAGTTDDDGVLVTSGGRVLGVCASGTTLHEAIGRAYTAVEHIQFKGKMYRTDIGKKGLGRETA